MARLVRLEPTGPLKLTAESLPADGKPLFFCQCGLSKKFPYCDGAHKTTAKLEQPGILYVYADDGTILEQRPDTQAKPAT